MNSVFRIELCGGIASGKTTLAKLLAKIDFTPLCENFKENPFWNDFHSDPEKFMFETELSFLLQHYNQIKKNEKKKIVCDYSLVLDIPIRAYVRKGKSKSSFLLPTGWAIR